VAGCCRAPRCGPAGRTWHIRSWCWPAPAPSTPIAGTPLSYAVNTNWSIFFDGDTHTWYWLNNGAWLRASSVEGHWTPAGTLPPAFSGLPNDRNFADVRQQIPGRQLSIADVPQVFVSTVPAEIIVTLGAPQFTAIPGTSLQYVANTDAALFRDAGNGQFYYLVSGRWFSASSLNGPWTFATTRLPPDFARIPASSPRGFVLASVPGTAQAQEALIANSIPQTATVPLRNGPKFTPSFDGAPQYAPVPGTSLSYVTNASVPIVQVWDGVLTVPLMGSLDGQRATEMMERLLAEIVRARARYAILDLTAVAVVDTSTADHLVRIVRAIELLGARAIIAGISPAVAQTMVSLGVDLTRLTTLRNLQEALKACMHWIDAAKEQKSGAALK